MSATKLAVGICLFFLAAAGFYLVHTQAMSSFGGLPTKTIFINNAPVVVELATSEAEREQGLSGRPVLPAGRGMLFVFKNDGGWGIWMKGMRFAIDILWLSQDGTIVSIQKNLAPETYPEVFKSDTPARYVLELPAGFVAASGIVVGEKVRLN